MRNVRIFLFCLSLALTANAQNLPNAPSAQKTTLNKIGNDAGWPRTFNNAGKEFVIYQPQVDKWDGARVYLYSAVELKSGGTKPSNYGVAWFSARTEVDKVNRLVTLDNVEISKVQFPAAKDQEFKILTWLQAKMPGKTKTISLDRMESALKAAAPKFEGIDVKNDPPTIIFSTKPSILVTIDGDPKLTDVKTTGLTRVVNTTAVVLRDTDKNKYYLRVMDWWLEAAQLDGPWVRANKLSDEMKKAEEYLVSQAKAQVGPGGEPANAENDIETKQDSLKEASKNAQIPAVFVVYAPAELIETQGEPQFESVQGLGLLYVKNTNATILRLGQKYYILVSGRWFMSNSLQAGWTFVHRGTLPVEFGKIPVDSPMAKILVSVPGTPQAEEALIANSIPQTATITRSEAKLTVVYDGEAIFVPIEGTTLKYARNTSAPVIKVSDNDYYSVEAGVWFKAPTPQGPWRVAESVPEAIYTIPASSPLHYVTYAKVYGATPEVVYVGYTPGYYGTVVSSSTTTVVYGSGWYYPPYIGPTVWYGYPYTYGVGAGFTWTDSSGWSFGFGFGYTYYPYYPWWGPMGYYGCCWYPYYGWGAWGGAAAANVYGRWGNTAYSRTAAAWANPYTGNYGAGGRGATYNTQTGRIAAGGRGYNTNIYTGNTAGYRGAAVYDPNSGIVAGAGAGFAGNRYTGEGTAGRGGFAYNTNTNAGIAAGKNNVYAGQDGTVYRYDRQSGNWSENSGNGWKSAERPGGSGNTPTLQRQQEARAQGAQRSQNFSSMRSGMPRRMGGGRR
jgi:hypothetical protein